MVVSLFSGIFRLLVALFCVWVVVVFGLLCWVVFTLFIRFYNLVFCADYLNGVSYVLIL